MFTKLDHHHMLQLIRFLAGASIAITAAACGGSNEDPAGSGSSASSGKMTLACGSADLRAEIHDACGAMDAIAVPDAAGSCDCFLGFIWDGDSCESLADCACEGDDCNKLFDSIDGCEQAHAVCIDPPTKKLTCGSASLHENDHGRCDPMDARATHDDELGPCDCFLGYAWDGEQCAMLGDCACEGNDCDKLFTSQEECEAAQAACVEPRKTLSCSSAERFAFEHEACAPMDAEAVGDVYGHCDCFLGFAWNGSECVGLGDCWCVGEDCDKLTESLEQCEQAHAMCTDG